MAIQKKFVFLDLDNDKFVEEVSKPSFKWSQEREEQELYLAKVESLRIEREFIKRKTLEREKLSKIENKNIKQKEFESSIEKETNKIKKIEKESKKSEEKFQLKKKLREKFQLDLEKINLIEIATKKIKNDYFEEKLNNKTIKPFGKDEVDSNSPTIKLNLVNENIGSIFNKVEKFEVKTNIYLRKDLYEKIAIIRNETGKSRSAIINKMIEIALKNI